jgi:hypothetical protein
MGEPAKTARLKSSARRGVRTAAYLIGLIAFVVLAAPLPSKPVGQFANLGDIDASWALVLHHALLHGLRFGHDLVFTYGPLGLMAAPAYYPPSFALMLALNSTFLLVTGWVWMMHWRRAGVHPVMWVVAATAAGISVSLSAEMLPQLPPLLLLAMHVQGRRSAAYPWKSILMLAGMCGAALLIKSTLWFSSSLVIGLVAADLMWIRKFPWPVAAAACGTVIGWVAAGQRLADLPPYFFYSLQIIRGYREMAVGLSPLMQMWAALWVVTSVLLLIQGARSFRARCGRRFAWAATAVLAGLLFLFYKEGFTRADSLHLSSASLFLGATVVLLAPLFRWKRSLLGWALATSALLLLSYTDLYAGLSEVRGDLAGRLRTAGQILGGRAPEQLRYAAYQQQIAARFSGVDLSGTFDVFSFGQPVLLMQDVAYRPRPVFQSYSVYTPELARLNAAFLASAEAPEHLLFAPQPIDGRYPSIEDASCWPVILANYDPRPATVAGLAILDRRRQPRRMTVTLLVDSVVRLGDPVAVPSSGGGLVWAQVDLSATVAGRVAGIVYQEPQAQVEVELARGGRRVFRLMPSTSAGGFLLSPLVANGDQFRELYAAMDAAGPAGAEVHSLRLVAGPMLPTHARVRLSVLHFAP